MWARTVQTQLVPAGAPDGFQANLLADFEASYGADMLGITVMRIRGEFITTNAPAIWGIRVFSEPTLADLDDAQGPVSSPHLDWMMYHPTSLLPATPELRTVVDVRAMRKIDELGQGLLLHVQSQVIPSSPNISFNVSTLVALP